MNKKVAIVMGSKSDMELAKKAEDILKDFDVEFETFVISAHRTPNRIKEFASNASKNGFGVIIGIAGLAAHLPGVVASLTLLPVIGVPGSGGPLSGQDALYSIVQMPSGIPVATVGIGNSKNAALLAIQILATGNASLFEKLEKFRDEFGDSPNS